MCILLKVIDPDLWGSHGRGQGGEGGRGVLAGGGGGDYLNSYLVCCFFGCERHSAFRLTALIQILQGASFRNQLIIFFTVPSFVRLSIFGSHPNRKQYLVLVIWAEI